MLQNVKGMKDWDHPTCSFYSAIIQKIENIGELYNFLEIKTPIVEYTGVFQRSLGDLSDIVHKEMYTFPDRSNNSLTLRPESTASTVRFGLNNKILKDKNNLVHKFFSIGPHFRYERPQKNRLRQFYQANFEMFGLANFESDLELIIMAYNIIKVLGLDGKVKLYINSIGDTETRKEYELALIDYFTQIKEQLSSISQQRLVDRKPLRILDSKDEADKVIVKDAPKINNYYTKEAKEFFDNLLKSLKHIGIQYEVNPNLVRGLDYYSHTVFEFQADSLGAQSTVIAGGRYDGLVESMGGADIPALGFAIGIERIADMVSHDFVKKLTLISVIFDSNSNSEYLRALQLATYIRSNLKIKIKFAVDLIYTGNQSRKVKKAKSNGSSLLVSLYESQDKVRVTSLKDNQNHSDLPESDILDKITNLLS